MERREIVFQIERFMPTHKEARRRLAFTLLAVTRLFKAEKYLRDVPGHRSDLDGALNLDRRNEVSFAAEHRRHL